MRIRKPTDRIADCCWFPRIIDKARLWLSGELPSSYRLAFCSQFGLDGYFLRYFHIGKKDFLQAVNKPGSTDDVLEKWFLAQPRITSERISEWNSFAPRMGTKGYPGYWTFHLVKCVLYPKAVKRPVDTLFEAISQDEE